MTRNITAAVLALLACGAARSQPAKQVLTFEVASVKPSSPLEPGEARGRTGCFLAPGSRNRFLCARASIASIVLYAYNLKPYELPAVSADTSQFNIEAILPSGATAAQVPDMMKNLLIERFKLVFHREGAEVKGYALVVAKSGLKMKESSGVPVIGDVKPASEPVKDADGFVYIPGVRNYMQVSRANGLTRLVANNVALDPEVRNAPCLTPWLYSLIQQPVIDATGLKGKYDFTLTFNSDRMETGASITGSSTASITGSGDGGVGQAGEPGPTVFKAVEEQLGLKLEARRIPVQLFVIDHVDQVPSGN